LCSPLLLNPLFFLVAIFVVAHQPHYGWLRGSGDLYKVDPIVRASECESVRTRHDAKILSLFANDAELRCGYLIVDAGLDYASIISAVVE
jgi:hypothetical protein